MIVKSKLVTPVFNFETKNIYFIFIDFKQKYINFVLYNILNNNIGRYNLHVRKYYMITMLHDFKLL